MPRNPILEELHEARRKLLEDVDGDLHRYVAEARQRLLESGRTIAEPKQRTTRCTGAAKSGVANRSGAGHS